MVRRIEPRVAAIVGRTDFAHILSGAAPGDRLAVGSLLGLKDGAEVLVGAED